MPGDGWVRRDQDKGVCQADKWCSKLDVRRGRLEPFRKCFAKTLLVTLAYV
jgi:hypothetical protein